MSVRIIPFDYREIGREIRARRNKLGMTQRQLAAKIPCSLTYISRIENGAKPSLEVLVRIAHILDMSLDSIFCVQAEDDTEFTRVLRVVLHQSPEVRQIALNMLYACLHSPESSGNTYEPPEPPEPPNLEDSSSIQSLLSDAPEDWQ